MNPYICRIVMLTYQNDRYHQTSRHRGKHRGKQIADTDYTNLRLRSMQGERLLHVSRCARNADGNIRHRCVFLSSWRYGMGGGTPAVCWAFIFPLMVMLLSLWICMASGLSEAASAGLSLALLIPYYITLRLCHKRLAGRFVFSVTR